jgi:hypothetical protein
MNSMTSDTHFSEEQTRQRIRNLLRDIARDVVRRVVVDQGSLSRMHGNEKWVNVIELTSMNTRRLPIEHVE